MGNLMAESFCFPPLARLIIQEVQSNNLDCLKKFVKLEKTKTIPFRKVNTLNDWRCGFFNILLMPSYREYGLHLQQIFCRATIHLCS